MNKPISSLPALFECYLEKFVEPGKQVNWAFRGESVDTEDKELNTSLERACKDLDVTYKLDLEEKLFVEFQRRYSSHVSQSPPGLDEIFDWMALMQHHGAPTRLLDFTYSFFIAVYFALKGCKKDKICTVWAVDCNWLDSTVRKCQPQQVEKLDRARGEGKFKDIFSCSPLFVFQLNPLRLNQRLTIQQGVFLCPGDASVSFMENLKAIKNLNVSDFEKHVIRTAINAGAKNEILRALHRMNINDAALFPGLDGFARSLHTKLLTLQDISAGPPE